MERRNLSLLSSVLRNVRPLPGRAATLSLCLLTTCALLAASCTEEPDIIEASAGDTPTTPELPTTTALTGSEQAPPEQQATTAPDTTTSPTTEPPPTPPTEPSLTDEVAIGIAADFVDALRKGNASGDLSTAAEMWSGYPAVQEDRTDHLAILLNVHAWLLDGELGYERVDGWAFSPEFVTPIVVITNPDRSLVATLLLDRTGTIQRIDSEVFQSYPEVTADADAATFDGVPIEGGANAYLDGVLLGEPTVDFANLTTTFVLPPPTGGTEVLVASFATPELPFATAKVIDRN